MLLPGVIASHKGPLRPLCLAAFSFAAALAIAHYLLPFEGAGIVALASFACGLIAGIPLLLKKKNQTLLLVFLALTMGFIWRWGFDRLFVTPALAWDGQTVPIQAESLDFSRKTPYGVGVFTRVTMPDGHRFRCVLYLNDTMEVGPGDLLSLTAKCVAPAPGTPDDRLVYDRPHGVVLLAAQAGDVSLDRPPRVPPTRWPALIAGEVRQRLSAALPAQQAALAQGLLIGGKADFDEGFRMALNDTGLAHVVSVSGLHVSFLVGAVILLVGNRKRAFWLGMPVVFLFVAVAGAPASAVRSGIMQAMLLLSYVLGRDEDSLTALSLSLLALVAWNPYAVADVGLQLSFASTLGIVLFAGRFRDAMEARVTAKALPRLRRSVLSSLAVSLSVLIFASPLIAVYYNTLSLISPLANLLTLGLVSFLFLGSLLLVGLSLIAAWLAAVTGFVLTPGLSLFQWIVTSLSRFPFAALKLSSPYFALWALLVYILFWLYLLWPRQERGKLSWPVGCALAMLSLAVTLSWVRPVPLEIVTLDIGQGQCLLVLTPDQTAVIDCGGNVSTVAQKAVDTLKSMGRYRVDLLALTHAHADHAGAVEDLMAQMEVAHIALPAAESGGVTLREDIRFLARRQGVPVSEISEVTPWALGDQTSVTLYPPLGLQDENEMSMAMLIRTGDFELLVTGDMSAALERALVRRENLPDIEVLMAGHHGSRYATSNGLLEAVNPETAVISVGRNNYGHPSQETLDRLYAHGVETYRTDENGTVHILVTP